MTKYKDTRFNDRMKYCIRVLPHIHNMDGFFVAKLLKVKHGEKKANDDEDVPEKKVETQVPKKDEKIRGKKIHKKD